jgi:hypothetical protein
LEHTNTVKSVQQTEQPDRNQAVLVGYKVDEPTHNTQHTNQQIDRKEGKARRNQPHKKREQEIRFTKRVQKREREIRFTKRVQKREQEIRFTKRVQKREQEIRFTKRVHSMFLIGAAFHNHPPSSCSRQGAP